MAIINTTFGFVFVHVPRAAGTSVATALSPLCTALDIEIGASPFGEQIQGALQKRHGLGTHATASQIRAALGEPRWLRMTSFAVVRHPLSRLASAFFYLRQWDSPQNPLFEALNECKSFAEFLDLDLWISDPGPNGLFRPQAFWLVDPQRDTLVVDHVCRVESLSEDLPTFLRHIQVKPALISAEVPHLRQSAKQEEQQMLTSEQLRRVRARYARDLKIFGYNL